MPRLYDKRGDPSFEAEFGRKGIDPDPLGHGKGPFLPAKQLTWTPPGPKYVPEAKTSVPPPKKKRVHSPFPAHSPLLHDWEGTAVQPPGCVRDCLFKQCGPDGCGGTCGECEGPQDVCQNGFCVCQPDCEGKCGVWDGCGAFCPPCTGEDVETDFDEKPPEHIPDSFQFFLCPGGEVKCKKGQVCIGTGETAQCCTPDCAGKECGEDSSCGVSCGECAEGFMCTDGGQCEPIPCEPQCEGKQCGDDGCGGTCGQCLYGKECDDYGQCQCKPYCSPGKECGPDGCGGSCGECTGPQEECVSGKCDCIPDCEGEGKECGDDAVCEVSCGTCWGPYTCDSGKCNSHCGDGFSGPDQAQYWKTCATCPEDFGDCNCDTDVCAGLDGLSIGTWEDPVLLAQFMSTLLNILASECRYKVPGGYLIAGPRSGAGSNLAGLVKKIEVNAGWNQKGTAQVQVYSSNSGSAAGCNATCLQAYVAASDRMDVLTALGKWAGTGYSDIADWTEKTQSHVYFEGNGKWCVEPPVQPA